MFTLLIIQIIKLYKNTKKLEETLNEEFRRKD